MLNCMARPSTRLSSAGLLRNYQDLAAGLLLVGVGLAGMVLVDSRVGALVPGLDRLGAVLPPPLSSAHGAYLGAGSFPFGLFVLLGGIGAVLALRALMAPAEPLGVWQVRPVILIFTAVAVFGLAIRPLGLVVAGPIAIFVGSLATADFRWREVAASAFGTTAASIVIFGYLLKLPIPIAPWMDW
jgi:Tripartite tricarboxylate transporter TctB family